MRALLRDYFLRFTGLYKNIKPGIHIVNSHFVTPDSHEKNRDYRIFDNYLNFLSAKSKFVRLEEAVVKLENNDIPYKNAVLSFTFDDGFEECYTVIAPLLEKYGTRGTFFINANYIDSNVDYQKEFHNRIDTFTKKPMSWNQVIDLHKRGHLIGSHNLDHTNFAELSSDEIIQQLRRNKEILEEKLNYKCEYFAWTYGQFQHFPEKALTDTKKFHKYIFSATNYKQYFSMNREVINRRHLESFWSFSHVRYFLSFKKKFK